MDYKFNVQSSPHIRDEVCTSWIMLDVIISLIPAMVWGILRFGIYPVIIILVSVASCVLSETLYNILVKRKNTIKDLSCVVTGVIIALNMPPEVPFYIPIIASIFAIMVVKMLFGGLGQNFMNPAVAGRCFVLISFTSQMNNFNSKIMGAFNINNNIDALSTATPLALIKKGHEIRLIDMLLGYTPGTIGEISAICLLIGAIYLLVKKVISIQIPLCYILSFLIFIAIFSGRATDVNYIMEQLLGGGLIFAAFYMATDYVTSPVTPFGKMIYGMFLGVMTGLFRLYGKTPEAISYVILLGNLLVPMIENITIPRAFGREGM